MLPKPEPRARAKARADRAWAVRRRACEDAVWLRDGGRCRNCGGIVRRADPWPGNLGHVHEWPMRSAGNDGTDPRTAFLLCERCHLRGCHGWPRLVPRYRTARQAGGPIAFAWQREKVLRRIG